MRRAEHFLAFMKRFVQYLRTRMSVQQVETDSPTSFLQALQAAVSIDGKTLRFAYDRLQVLLRTLEISNTDDFMPITLVADFGTLVGTYARGFAIIIEPYDERMPNVPDPVMQLACLDASLAMKPVFQKFQSVVITSGTLSPIDLYPKLLDFHPVSIQSLSMTLTRDCLCPVVLTRGTDQMPVSTKYEMRNDPGARSRGPSGRAHDMSWRVAWRDTPRGMGVQGLMWVAVWPRRGAELRQDAGGTVHRGA